MASGQSALRYPSRPHDRRHAVPQPGAGAPAVDVGNRFPALISATGRCVAAFSGQPQKEIEKRFRLLRWHNAPTYEAWRKEVDQVRRQGFSIDRGNYIDGVTSKRVLDRPLIFAIDNPFAKATFRISTAFAKRGSFFAAS